MTSASTVTVAFLAQGKLYLADTPGAEPQHLESQFVQELLDRTERNRERNNWKDDGLAWNIRAGGASPFMANGRPAEVRRIEFTSVARGHNPGEFFYAISTDSVGGIFLYERNGDYERRLVHRNQLRVEDLCLHPQERTLALSIRNGDGTATIATMEVERRGINVVTEGDSVDESPAWVPGRARELVYQSAGIARDPNGFFRALGPYAAHRLDLDGGKHEPIVQDEGYDYLLPRVDAGGRLLLLRRPYEPFSKPSLLKTTKDALLFPFGVARTIVHFLHWMSLAFSGKPLISAGGPQQRGPVPEHLMLWGRMVEASRIIRAGGGDTPTLVPADWQLIARADNGTHETIAKHVVHYEVAADGSLVYSDGRRIYHLLANGTQNCIGEGKLIQKLALIG